MKPFLTALAANFVTIALVVVIFFIVVAGVIAALGSGAQPTVAQGAVLVIDLDEPLADAPAERQRRSTLDEALSAGAAGVSVRAALLALRTAVDDRRISGIVVRGSVGETGFATLRELRDAITDFRTRSKKPVHAFLVNPQTRDYYVASAASTVTMDPFGSLLMPGISAQAVFISGLLEKYGIGVQVTRVGRFKAAVEPLTRSNMSPENRQQTERFVGALWSEVKRAIAESRGVDTVTLQRVIDEKGILLAEDARAAGLVDRVAYWDVVLADLRGMVAQARGGAAGDTASSDTAAGDNAGPGEEKERRGASPQVPQVTLADYAILAHARGTPTGAAQKVAIVYASGTIVDGEGGSGLIGGDALARELRRVRSDAKVKAVVLRVNSPGGSAVASETMQRELALIARSKPVVVSMGTLAASGGYWISTAATRIFAQPNTITGSIGVFGLMPNIRTLANRQGVTFDTVKTGRYADIFSITRPRTPAELAVVQRSTDAIYDAFIARVAAARGLSPDSVRMIADGRVWSGEDAVRIGLVDSLGGIEDAIRSAAGLGGITGEYGIDEYPRRKRASEVLSEMIDRKPPPVARLPVTVGGHDAVRVLARDLLAEFEALLTFNDPRGAYARLPYILRIQ